MTFKNSYVFILGVLLSLTLFSSPIAASSPPASLAQAQHWAISDGMTSHTVTDLLQDNHGFLWIATRNGLQRFDGVLFEHYTAGREPNQLPSNHIIDLWFNEHQLWVATANGVAYFDYQQSRFYRHPDFIPKDGVMPPRVSRIIANHNNEMLLLADKRLWRATKTTAKPLRLSYNGDPLNAITNIHLGERWIWLTEENGNLYVWDGQSFDVFKITRQNPITEQLPAVGFNHILQRGNEIWLAHDKGLILLDADYRVQQTLDNENDLASTTAINRLAYVDNGHLLLGTDNGIKILETNGTQPAYLSDQHELSLPPLLLVNAFTVDHLQRLWVGAENGGLYQFSMPRSALNFDSLNDASLTNELARIDLPDALKHFTTVVKDYDSFFWLTAEVGLIKYDPQQQRILEVYPLPASPQHNVVQAELFAEQLFLIDQKQGLLIFDISEKDWRSPPSHRSFFSQENLRLALKDNMIWVADEYNAVAINEFFNVVKQIPLVQNASLTDLRPLFVVTGQHQQTLHVNFVSPLAPAPEQVQYRYRLFDIMDEWQYTTRPLQSISFDRLPAATYDLQIQASTDGANWGPKYQQQFAIAGPWWQSSWAVAGFSLFTLALLLSGIRWIQRLYQHQRQQQEANQSLYKAVQCSGDQFWDWQVQNNELTRYNIWSDCADFPIDGIRNGFISNSNIHPNDLERVQQCINALLDATSDKFETSYRIKNKDNWLWVMDRGQVSACTDTGMPTRIQGALTNISGMINSEERLNMLALSLTNISDGICIFDRFFRKREVNKAYESITGYQREQALDQPFALGAYDQEFTDQIKRSVFKDGSWRGELSDIRADGSEFLMELTLDTVTNENGEIELIVASFSDITERRNTENELRRLSNTDSLTGLPNRSYFQVSHSNLVRKKIAHALLVFDLDDFKKINDSIGHEVGDELLCRVAERLTDIGRRQDTLYRLGGDEFGLLVEDSTDINTISLLASQINNEIAQPYEIQEHEVVIGSSIGIVFYPHDASTSQELLQKADTAMYHAKQRGGNCYQFFSQSMNENAIRRLHIEHELRSAIRDNRVEVFYQPKIEVVSQHIAGIEALARIRREDGTIMSPADFIPLAEETGLIVPLSEQVLRRACRDMKEFLKLPGSPRHVAINLSARQFLTSSLAFQVESILADEQMHPRHIEFEITEGMVMSDPERAITMLENLADMGVQLALDDFGTGYSSLAYLKRFPLHTLKIDKAFVDDISTDDKDRNMVASIVAMAHNLGLKVVAEGVESKTQLEILKTLRCEFIQGFYFSEPMQADDFIRYIEQHQTATTR